MERNEETTKASVQLIKGRVIFIFLNCRKFDVLHNTSLLFMILMLFPVHNNNLTWININEKLIKLEKKKTTPAPHQNRKVTLPTTPPTAFQTTRSIVWFSSQWKSRSSNVLMIRLCEGSLIVSVISPLKFIYIIFYLTI